MKNKQQLLLFLCLSMTLGGVPFQAAAKEGDVSRAEDLQEKLLRKFADNPVLFAEHFGVPEINTDNWSDILQAYQLYLTGTSEFRERVDALFEEKSLGPIHDQAIAAVEILNTLDQEIRRQWEPIVKKIRDLDKTIPEVDLPKEAVTIIAQEDNETSSTTDDSKKVKNKESDKKDSDSDKDKDKSDKDDADEKSDQDDSGKDQEDSDQDGNSDQDKSEKEESDKDSDKDKKDSNEEEKSDFEEKKDNSNSDKDADSDKQDSSKDDASAIKHIKEDEDSAITIIEEIPLEEADDEDKDSDSKEEDKDSASKDNKDSDSKDTGQEENPDSASKDDEKEDHNSESKDKEDQDSEENAEQDKKPDPSSDPSEDKPENEEDQAVTILGPAQDLDIIERPESSDDFHLETNVHPSTLKPESVEDPSNQPVIDLMTGIGELGSGGVFNPDASLIEAGWNAVIDIFMNTGISIPESAAPAMTTQPAAAVTNTYSDARPTIFDTSTLDSAAPAPSVFSNNYNFSVLHGTDKSITVKNLGSFRLLPDFTNDAAWKNSTSGYNTPGLWGQCTWFAWGRFYELYGFDPGFTGNGYQCVSQLLAHHPDKFELSKTPASGAVFSSDIFHNHVGIVLEYDKESNLMTIQEGNLDIISNPIWEEAISDYRTIQLTPAALRSMYGNVTYAIPKDGVQMKKSGIKNLSLRDITLNRLKKMYAAQAERLKEKSEEKNSEEKDKDSQTETYTADEDQAVSVVKD